MPVTDAPWAAQEVWAFEAHNDLRLVSIEGVNAVDPNQTRLPQEWRQFPTFLMEPGRVMRLVEKRRGDADPAPDQLNLERKLWLDFGGGGYTFQDGISGPMNKSWRLEMTPRSSSVAWLSQITTRSSHAAPLTRRPASRFVRGNSEWKPTAGSTAESRAYRRSARITTSSQYRRR